MRHFFLLVTLLMLSRAVLAAETPNVIVIMADDLGFGDVGAYGADPSDVATPNIDRLANQGLRFTSGYASNSTCTPTRYTFLTGQYAWRKADTGIGGINSTLKIDTNRTTIADVLKSAGYATAVVGKWHLGLGSGSAPNWNGQLNPGPLELGFDYCFLLPNTNDRVPSVYVENHVVKNLDPINDPLIVSNNNPDGQPEARNNPDLLLYTGNNQHSDTIHNRIGRIGYMSGATAARWRDEDMADDFIDVALPWIEANKDGPFFLFLSSQDCHVPRLPHERFQGQSALGWRGDAIVQLDWMVGEVIDKVIELQIQNNTLIVLCSDNGPVLNDGYSDNAVSLNTAAGHEPSGVYQGGKYSVYEGGTRTPFITWWPGRIAPGTVSDEIVCSMDLPASLAALTGQSVPGDAFPDSFNIMDAFLGVAGAKGREHLIQANNTGSQLGFREGKWKLWRTSGLYNLDADPGEQNNLASQNPTKLGEMIARRDELRAMQGTAWLLWATAGDAEVVLNWVDSNDPNFASYRVLRGTSAGGPYTQIAAGLTASGYTDSTARNGVTYYYVFRTVLDDGNESANSNEVQAAPVAPGLVQQAEDASIVSARINTVGSGWNGSGFVDLEESGYVDFSIGTPYAGSAELSFRVAGAASNMAARISVNGTVTNSALPCPNTGSWNSVWQLVTQPGVELQAGTNTIRFEDNGNNQPQLDQLEVLNLRRAGELPPYDGVVNMQELAALFGQWLGLYDMETFLDVAANWLTGT